MPVTSPGFEPEVRQVLEWNPATTASAETEADTGQLSSAATLCERLLADDRGKGVCGQRASIGRLPLTFEGGSRKAVRRLEKDGDFWRIVPATQLEQLHRWYAMFGLGLGRLNWVDEFGKPLMRAGKHVPRVEAWSSARHLERDTINREWTCEVGSNGRREVIRPGQGGWLLWSAASDRPWSMGAWRACRLWWLLKQYAIQDWARYSERHGLGTLVVRVPKGQGADTKPQRQSLARQFKQLGSNGVVVLRDNWTAELIEATARSYETFKAQIEAANAGIAIAILGQNLTSEVKSGSLASAKVHENIAADIVGNDAESLSDFVHDQILVPWAIANYGSADAAPWPVWDTTPPEEAKPRIDAWVALGDAIQKLASNGAPIDVIAMCEQAGVPLLAGEKAKAPPLKQDDESADESDDEGNDDDSEDDTADGGAETDDQS